MSMRSQALSLAVGLAMTCMFMGCGSTSDADGELGDTTTKAAVMRALEGTGYKIFYRVVPRVEGYEMVAGRARSKAGGVVDFSVVIDVAGPIEGNPEGRHGGSPQFPIVRYSQSAGTITGNIYEVTQEQSRFVLGRSKRSGAVWLPSNGETEMSIRIGLALDRLFAPGVIEGP